MPAVEPLGDEGAGVDCCSGLWGGGEDDFERRKRLLEGGAEREKGGGGVASAVEEDECEAVRGVERGENERVGEGGRHFVGHELGERGGRMENGRGETIGFCSLGFGLLVGG